MHPFAWLGLATSVVLALRGVGCPCPAVQLLPFWRVASAELVDSLEVFCFFGEPAADATLYAMMAETRPHAALPWLALVHSFAVLSATLWREMPRLKSSHLVEDLLRRQERMLLRRYGPLSEWPEPADVAERLLDLQHRSRSAVPGPNGTPIGDIFSPKGSGSDDCFPKDSMDIFAADLDISLLAPAEFSPQVSAAALFRTPKRRRRNQEAEHFRQHAEQETPSPLDPADSPWTRRYKTWHAEHGRQIMAQPASSFELDPIEKASEDHISDVVSIQEIAEDHITDVDSIEEVPRIGFRMGLLSIRTCPLLLKDRRGMPPDVVQQLDEELALQAIRMEFESLSSAFARGCISVWWYLKFSSAEPYVPSQAPTMERAVHVRAPPLMESVLVALSYALPAEQERQAWAAATCPVLLAALSHMHSIVTMDREALLEDIRLLATVLLAVDRETLRSSERGLWNTVTRAGRDAVLVAQHRLESDAEKQDIEDGWLPDLAEDAEKQNVEDGWIPDMAEDAEKQDVEDGWMSDMAEDAEKKDKEDGWIAKLAEETEKQDMEDVGKQMPGKAVQRKHSADKVADAVSQGASSFAVCGIQAGSPRDPWHFHCKEKGEVQNWKDLE
ncbi:hypothetical protein AK812_SmicGene14872 [Symbiodinium microadriaticum]|uniref:Uncharacterized protein n=1 Tax=Symbiodinium microadriaticum TaxID=2951 RepID=A0A1Q9E4G0_SYMMI|nr:hypothetical protein AK812_SmicGene14872 [Symbiodinium microadriaticum]